MNPRANHFLVVSVPSFPTDRTSILFVGFNEI